MSDELAAYSPKRAAFLEIKPNGNRDQQSNKVVGRKDRHRS